MFWRQKKIKVKLELAKDVFFDIFLTNQLDITGTIIPLALMASEAIAYSAFGPIGY